MTFSPLDIALGIGLVTLAGWFVVLYNGLIALRNDCDRAWGNIDVLLRQRYDELPNLVETCRAYMTHERETLTRVTEARRAGLNARTPAEADHAAARTGAALSQVLGLVESYPELQASRNFLALQHRITGIENEIADRREYFNHAVTAWNTRIEMLPDRLVAGMIGARRRDLLRLPGIERTVPRVAA